MQSAKRIGQTIGVLLLVQMACGLVLPFVLWRPLISGSPAFLTAASANSYQIRAGVFLSFVGAALTVAIAITAWPVIRQHSESIALWFLVVCAISCALDATQNATVMSMLSISQQYLKAGIDTAPFTSVGFLLATIRRWVHYTQLVGFGSWIFLFYYSLLRFKLVPSALAIFGLVGILLQFTGVTLLAFLGFGSMIQLALPLAPIHIANGLWLIFKGLRPHTLGSSS